jgi:hypothetical protein
MDQRTELPLMYDAPALRRVFRRIPRAELDRWMSNGHLPARVLPDGRRVVLREELLEMLRSLPLVASRPGGVQ